MANVLGIETSCDETSVAILKDGSEILANIVSSQVKDHAVYGGVVPEVASRRHLTFLKPILDQAFTESGLEFNQIDLVSATNGPGLIGALLMGVSAAKAIAYSWGVPYIGVNHIEGHLFSSMLEDPSLKPPMIVLLVSGGHTQIVLVEKLGEYKILGSTIDDAAGEAFDKVARYLGLGYPGGPLIDKLASQGDKKFVKFPRALMDGSYNFSFSGLKTSAINYINSNPNVSEADFAASFQEAVVDVLVKKTVSAAKEYNVNNISVGGGVAANSRLREKLNDACSESGLSCHWPSLEFCTDNAAMIAAVGFWQWQNNYESQLNDGADPSLKLGSH